MSKFKFSFVAFIIFPIPNSRKFVNMALCEMLNKKWQMSLLLYILLKYDCKIF